MNRYVIYQIGEFFELFDLEERISLFATEDEEVILKVEQYYRQYGELPEEI